MPLPATHSASATHTSMGGLRVSIYCLMMTLFTPMISSHLNDRSPVFVAVPNACECTTLDRILPRHQTKTRNRPLCKGPGGRSRTAMSVAASRPMSDTVVSRRATLLSFH